MTCNHPPHWVIFFCNFHAFSLALITKTTSITWTPTMTIHDGGHSIYTKRLFSISAPLPPVFSLHYPFLPLPVAVFCFHCPFFISTLVTLHLPFYSSYRSITACFNLTNLLPSPITGITLFGIIFCTFS